MAKRRASYAPYWTAAKYDCVDSMGRQVKTGDRIFYYPSTKTVMTGEEAEAASREYQSTLFDESVMGARG